MFVISVAAQLAGLHPQTLRQYDRLGLVSPGRTRGRGRRYSLRDVAMLREVQRLSQEEGVNLAGIKRIMELQQQVDRLSDQVAELRSQLQQRKSASDRVFAAGASGDVVALRAGSRPTRRQIGTALTVWRPTV